MTVLWSSKSILDYPIGSFLQFSNSYYELEFIFKILYWPKKKSTYFVQIEGVKLNSLEFKINMQIIIIERMEIDKSY